jgi:Domain of unknown function (DUF1330)
MRLNLVAVERLLKPKHRAVNWECLAQGASPMPAYVIATETVENEAMFADYRPAVPETLAPFGARFVVRGGTLSVLEGEWPHPRLVIIDGPAA